jgi:hypothetical protein
MKLNSNPFVVTLPRIFNRTPHFETDGCCILPAEINVEAAGTDIDMIWTFVSPLIIMSFNSGLKELKIG